MEEVLKHATSQKMLNDLKIKGNSIPNDNGFGMPIFTVSTEEGKVPTPAS